MRTRRPTNVWYGQRRRSQALKKGQSKLDTNQILSSRTTSTVPDDPIHVASQKIYSKVYSPLRGRTIRLVTLHAGSSFDKIQCHLQEVRSVKPESYVALSYVWGSTQDPATIFLNSQEFLITQNLAEALKELRLPDTDRVLWIDALCINQSDNSEKSNQVPLMGSIYENATSVIAWLGPHENGSVHAFEMLKRVEYDGNPIPAIVTLDNSQAAFLALTPLMSRDYWFRAWIVQEIAFAQELRIRSGSDEVLYTTLQEVLCLPCQPVFLTLTPPKWSLRSQNNIHTSRHFDQPTLDERLLEPGLVRDGKSISPETYLGRLLDRRCLHGRDNVLAFYNLFSDEIKELMDTSYSSPEDEFFIQATRAIIEGSQNLYIITIKGRQLRPKKGELLACKMPSWCPHFGTSFRCNSIAPKSETGYTTPGAVVKFLDKNRTLVARGFTIGTIDEIVHRKSRPTEKFQSLKNHNDFTNEMEHIKICLHFALSLDFDADDEAACSAKFEALLETLGIGDYELPLCELLYKERKGELDFSDFDAVHLSILSEVKFFTHSRRVCSFETALAMSRTLRNRFALVPSTARKNDIICYIFGCKVPVVLHQIAEHYKVLGEAYVHEITDQNTLKYMSKRSNILKDFMLR
jgi:hypothetical protein